MDLEYVTKLIDLLAKSKIDELEIEEDGKKIRIAKNLQPFAAVQPTVFNVAPAASPAGAVLPQASAAVVAPAAPASGPKLHEVRSPIVGTFYHASAPDAAAFVQVGSVVQKGTILCIIEAMKLMNEIESDLAGKIVQIMIENGQPVEYDQVLFLVEPA